MDTSSVDLLALIGQDVPLKRQSNHAGGEYHGPCPFCGGFDKPDADRFVVWPRRNRYWCRKCHRTAIPSITSWATTAFPSSKHAPASAFRSPAPVTALAAPGAVLRGGDPACTTRLGAPIWTAQGRAGHRPLSNPCRWPYHHASAGRSTLGHLRRSASIACGAGRRPGPSLARRDTRPVGGDASGRRRWLQRGRPLRRPRLSGDCRATRPSTSPMALPCPGTRVGASGT